MRSDAGPWAKEDRRRTKRDEPTRATGTENEKNARKQLVHIKLQSEMALRNSTTRRFTIVASFSLLSYVLYKANTLVTETKNRNYGRGEWYSILSYMR